MAQQEVKLTANTPKTVDDVQSFQNTSSYYLLWAKGDTVNPLAAYENCPRDRDILLGGMQVTFQSEYDCSIMVEV